MITAAAGSVPVAKPASAARLRRIRAETAGADQAFRCATNRQSASPIRRLTRAHTCSGSSRASRRAPSPTTCSSGEANSTTEGVVGSPDSPASTSGRPSGPTQAMAELVVPRSIPWTATAAA